MRKTLFVLVVLTLTLPLYAEDPPSSEPRPPLPPPPTIAHIEIQRPLVERLKTPEEDEAYFRGVKDRFKREEIVIVNQTRMSLKDSYEELTIIYLLTVYDSTGECYGLCKEAEPVPDEGPRFHRHIVPIEPELIPATLTGGFFLYTKNRPNGWFFVTSSAPQTFYVLSINYFAYVEYVSL